MSDYAPLKNDLLLRAARRQYTERTPVWIMRQAGRYLPEYRALRSEEEFFTLCRTPELAAEVTLQPVDRFPLDAAIIFSDILVVPQAMGLEVRMVKGKGPHFPEPLRGPDDLGRLLQPNVPEALDYVMEAIKRVYKELQGRIPLIGFCGAPWTLMAYMIEGGGSKTFSRSRAWLFCYPDESRRLLQQITEVLVDFLVAQIHAGAQAVQVFDSWAGFLSPATFEAFALPYLRQIAARVGEVCPDVPRIVFAKGAHYALPALVEAGFDVVGLDWTIDPGAARTMVNGGAALQGNMDPSVLYAKPDVIRAETRSMLEGFGPHAHIANLGHGMNPDHDPERALVFIEAVQELSAKLRE